ncbi:MAG: hypothetical protein ABIL58_23715 [Pseudomonadota bacterium]
MTILLDPAISFLENQFSWAEMGTEERRKRSFLAVSILVPVPFAVVYGLNDLLSGRLLEGSVVIGVMLILMTNLLLLRIRENTISHLRITALLALMLLTNELSLGGGEGNAFVWFYFFPITMFYLFGTGEGSWWVAASITISATFLVFDAGQFHYPATAACRFMVTYLIVSIVSCAVECSRKRCYQALLEKSLVLEKALRQRPPQA